MINSILDTDMYKLTMQQAVLELYPNATARYKFINRRASTIFSPSLANWLHHEINENMRHLQLLESEASWLREKCPFFKPWYIEYLKTYRFNPCEVKIEWENNALQITIGGPWHSTILWEVPLMALISELYFGEQETRRDEFVNHNEYRDRTAKKAIRLSSDCPHFQAGFGMFSDFGTRRRRSYDIHNLTVDTLAHTKEPHHKQSLFCGTSNLHFAKIHNLNPIGTMAHEWIMAHSILSGLRHANRAALEAWVKVYRGELGIALTDTYGLKLFWEDFDTYFAKLFDGVRHDSGDPFKFVDQAVAHYKKLNIIPLHKIVVFSDGLDVDKALALREYCWGKIGCSFGIGTHFTNDVPDDPALNMVIKLDALNGEPVCKLGEGTGKASGDPIAIRSALEIVQQAFDHDALSLYRKTYG